MRFFISSSILPFIIVLAVSLLPLSSCGLIESTCKHTPNYRLCVSILRSNPRSRNADITGLSLIMVDAVKAKVKSALQSVNELEKYASRHVKKPLNECRRGYVVVLKYDVSVAVEALTKGDQKFAVDGMNDSAIEARLCEDGFDPSRSPLTRMNKAVIDVSLVAAAVIRLLL